MGWLNPAASSAQGLAPKRGRSKFYGPPTLAATPHHSTPVAEPITLRAVVDLLHPRVKAGEYVVWHPDTGAIRAVRDLATSPGVLAGALADGTLTPAQPSDAPKVAAALRSCRLG
jgi:hypothetical protein